MMTVYGCLVLHLLGKIVHQYLFRKINEWLLGTNHHDQLCMLCSRGVLYNPLKGLITGNRCEHYPYLYEFIYLVTSNGSKWRQCIVEYPNNRNLFVMLENRVTYKLCSDFTHQKYKRHKIKNTFFLLPDAIYPYEKKNCCPWWLTAQTLDSRRIQTFYLYYG